MRSLPVANDRDLPTRIDALIVIISCVLAWTAIIYFVIYFGR